MNFIRQILTNLPFPCDHVSSYSDIYSILYYIRWIYIKNLFCAYVSSGNSTVFVVVRSNFSYWFKIVNTHFVDCNNVWKCLWLNLEEKINGSVHLTKILRTCQIRFKKCTRDSDMPTDLAIILVFYKGKNNDDARVPYGFLYR